MDTPTTIRMALIRQVDNMASPYDWSPESVQSSRRYGTNLMQQGADYSPVGHWTQAIARALQGGVGGYMVGQANEGERAGKEGVANAYKEGIAKNLPMKQIAAQLMGNPWGQEQGQQMAGRALETEQSQSFQREQQDRGFKQQMQLQGAQFGQQRSMAQMQHDLQLKLMNAKSEMERKQLLDQGRALGIIPPEASPQAAPAMPQQGGAPMPPQGGGQPMPAQPGMPQTSAPQAAPSDPYDRMLTPAKSAQQLEAERRQKAGQSLLLGDPKGAAKIMNKEDDLKEHQTKDALWSERMMRSEVNLRGIERQYQGAAGQGSPASKINNFWPDTGIVANMTNSQSFREYQQASREWIAAMLRKDTGAAVTETEWKLYFPTYFPQPGDSPQVIEQKRAARMAAARGLREASGPAFDRMYPNTPQELRGQINVQNQVPARNERGLPQGAQPVPGGHLAPGPDGVMIFVPGAQ
jgi:hypothetical protein